METTSFTLVSLQTLTKEIKSTEAGATTRSMVKVSVMISCMVSLATTKSGEEMASTESMETTAKKFIQVMTPFTAVMARITYLVELVTITFTAKMAMTNFTVTVVKTPSGVVLVATKFMPAQVGTLSSVAKDVTLSERRTEAMSSGEVTALMEHRHSLLEAQVRIPRTTQSSWTSGTRLLCHSTKSACNRMNSRDHQALALVRHFLTNV